MVSFLKVKELKVWGWVCQFLVPRNDSTKRGLWFVNQFYNRFFIYYARCLPDLRSRQFNEIVFLPALPYTEGDERREITNKKSRSQIHLYRLQQLAG